MFSHVTNQYLEVYYQDLEKMIDGMTTAHLTDSISHNFMVQMIPHHQMAIQMCENLLQYTTNIPLQNEAQGIIKDQTISIENMEECLPRCSTLTNYKVELMTYQKCFEKIADTMFCRMQQSCVSNDINQNFIREMIPHHKGALEMCRNVLQYDICDELYPIIDSIITKQRAGIKQLECIFRQL